MEQTKNPLSHKKKHSNNGSPSIVRDFSKDYNAINLSGPKALCFLLPFKTFYRQQFVCACVRTERVSEWVLFVLYLSPLRCSFSYSLHHITTILIHWHWQCRSTRAVFRRIRFCEPNAVRLRKACFIYSPLLVLHRNSSANYNSTALLHSASLYRLRKPGSSTFIAKQNRARLKKTTSDNKSLICSIGRSCFFARHSDFVERYLSLRWEQESGGDRDWVSSLVVIIIRAPTTHIRRQYFL